MAAIIPITLVGENLGKRHLYLNTLVNDSNKLVEDFDLIKNIPEQSSIDRLYKIDIASKIRNVDYIIQNLKDGDMLYVSRALKSTWLLDPEYENVMNPKYLEDQLYPEMITTAVTKLQHWIHLNLNDEVRCQQFYQHYYDKNVNIAIKFLLKCSSKDIQQEFTKIKHIITPHYFKVLCEKCPQIAKMFFESLSDDEELKNQYLDNDKKYYYALRHMLKTDADIVLDITERYFSRHFFNRFSKQQTHFIMIHHKKTFLQKPELYTAWLLNTQSIADNLNSEEAKELIVKLARAKYLADWFSYKSTEPLFKRVTADERASFKKKVFVSKDFGEQEEDWPYGTPEPPVRETKSLTIFDDEQHNPIEYENLKQLSCKSRAFFKKCCYEGDFIECARKKTLLDKLFDEYRFTSFEQTLFDLRKRIAAESFSQHREFMMLVLVSKSGGRPDAIASLLKLLEQHGNEPPNVRAAIIRSLVKRANVWRLPDSSWDQLLQFGSGLGLDGSKPVAYCYEGLHSVVIRSLLLTGKCELAVQNAFLTNFSTLTEYSLTPTEQEIIQEKLPQMLFSIVKEKGQVSDAIEYVDKLITTLKAYKIKVETYPGLIDSIVALAEKDIIEVNSLIKRLFDDKIARKQLFKYTFDLVKTDASYLNALRHDTSVLDAKKFAKFYTDDNKIRSELFLTKLSIYFNEKDGLASNFLNELKSIECVNVRRLGRPLAFLLESEASDYISKLDTLTDDKAKILARAIRANVHITRPSFDMNSFGWAKVGAKHVANRLLKCPTVEINKNIEELLKQKRTAKLALTLSKRTSKETEVFVKLAKLRPTVAIKSGLKLMKLYDNKVDPLIWETIKPIIQELDVTKCDRSFVVRSLSFIDEIPMKIRPEYSTVIYILFKKGLKLKAIPPLCYIEILLPDVNTEFIESLIEQFLNDFNAKKLSTDTADIKCNLLFIRILTKFLFLCKSDEVQKQRLDKIADPFLAIMEEIIKSPEKKLFSDYFAEMLKTFKYNKVFLDTQYVSALPVMEKVTIWMRKHFTIDEHFETFTILHLSMLYYKSVRQGLKLVPEVFADIKRRNNEGVKLVGNTLGKYIAKEVNSLKTKYFDSIPELYTESLLTYLENVHYYNKSSDFLSSIIKGIIEQSKGSEYRLAIYLIEEKYYSLEKEHSQELIKLVDEIKDRQSEWFSYPLLKY